MARKVAIIVVGAFVVIAVALALILTFTGGDDSTSDTVTTDGGDISSGDILDGPDGSGSTTTADLEAEQPTSDPDTIDTAFTLLAIGDWGATQYKEGSCCNHYRETPDEEGQDYLRDYHAQVNIGKLLAQSAAELLPEAILGHGDNIYWNGVGPEDATARMDLTFSSVYNQASLQNIPWFNVAGNHDIGGSSYICGERDEQYRPCESVAEMLTYLDLKFDLQKEYTGDSRWRMTDHYYKETITKDDVSVDIFNVDTNYADSHAAHQVCCQCYGYSQGTDDGCDSVQKGDAFCAGGDTDLYESCMAKIKTWWDDSVTQITRDLEASTATYKVINTHYSPHFHMGVDKMLVWYKICSDYGVHVWLNGHTHGFNHDISKFKTHFFENGGGGGIQSETSGNRPDQAAEYVDTQWIAAGDPYGYFELSFSADWIKVQFVTFDSDWIFERDAAAVIEGGIQREHCWHIPRTGASGQECAA